MKKLIITVVIIWMAIQAQAQVKIGLRGAPQITWSKHDNKTTATNGTRINMAYGMVIDYYFTENYAIGTEFTIQRMSTNLNLSSTKFDSLVHTGGNKKYASTDALTYDYRMSFIQIPIILKMRTKEIGNVRYYAEFGLNNGFMTRAKANVSMGAFELDNVNVNKPDDEDKFSVTPNDYDDGIAIYRAGLIIGGGLQYNLFGNSLLVAGLRYDNGFTQFTQDDKWSATLNYIGLNIGVLF